MIVDIEKYISEVASLSSYLSEVEQTRVVEKCLDSLFLAQSWLEKDFEDLVLDSGMALSKPTIVITSLVDRAGFCIENEIKRTRRNIDFLSLDSDFWHERLLLNPNKYNSKRYHTYALKHLSEAMFWLGVDKVKL